MARRKVLGEQALTAYKVVATPVNRKNIISLEPGFTWFANVDPITGWRLTTVPEGDRNKKNLYLHSTDVELEQPDQEAGTLGHVVVYRGEQYMIRDVMHFDRVLSHTEYRVMRVSSPIPLP